MARHVVRDLSRDEEKRARFGSRVSRRSRACTARRSGRARPRAQARGPRCWARADVPAWRPTNALAPPERLPAEHGDRSRESIRGTERRGHHLPLLVPRVDATVPCRRPRGSRPAMRISSPPPPPTQIRGERHLARDEDEPDVGAGEVQIIAPAAASSSSTSGARSSTPATRSASFPNPSSRRVDLPDVTCSSTVRNTERGGSSPGRHSARRRGGAHLHGLHEADVERDGERSRRA